MEEGDLFSTWEDSWGPPLANDTRWLPEVFNMSWLSIEACDVERMTELADSQFRLLLETLSELERNSLTLLPVDDSFRLFSLDTPCDWFFVALLVNASWITIGGPFSAVRVFRMFVFLDSPPDLTFSLTTGDDAGRSDSLRSLASFSSFLRNFDIILKWRVFLSLPLLNISATVVFFADFPIRDFWMAILLFIFNSAATVGDF